MQLLCGGTIAAASAASSIVRNWIAVFLECFCFQEGIVSAQGFSDGHP
jgi:hypothetical protein